MVVTQEVSTSWAKDSRGAPGAVARNAVPERLAFIPPVGHPAVLERLARYGEESGFVASETVASYDAPASLCYGCVRLVVADSRIQVMWLSDPSYIGAPGRDEGPPKEAFVVSVGQWGYVRYNGRLTYEEGWWYRKVVLNVGIFAAPTGSEFLVREPDFTYDKMAHLW
jgi:hypothetical protein